MKFKLNESILFNLFIFEDNFNRSLKEKLKNKGKQKLY